MIFGLLKLERKLTILDFSGITLWFLCILCSVHIIAHLPFIGRRSNESACVEQALFEETENIIVGGIAFKDLSVEKLTEVFGKPDIAYDTGDYYKWERGDYSIDIGLNEDGSLNEIGTDHNEH